MKVNELMIGDWAKGTIDRDERWQWEAEDYLNIDEDDIAPIPLTEDILKANGWVYDDFDDSYLHKECELILFTPWTENGGFVLSTYNTIEFKYVHELQHALRLCGLNDLADNFKIQ